MKIKFNDTPFVMFLYCIFVTILVLLAGGIVAVLAELAGIM
jgi:hypothetical protein